MDKKKKDIIFYLGTLPINSAGIHIFFLNITEKHWLFVIGFIACIFSVYYSIRFIWKTIFPALKKIAV